MIVCKGAKGDTSHLWVNHVFHLVLILRFQTKKDHRLQTVKVTFKTKEAAREFLRLRFNLIRNDDQHWSKFYLSPDRSPSDRKETKRTCRRKKRKIIEFPEKTWRMTKFLKLESFDRN